MQEQTFIVDKIPHNVGDGRCQECFSGFPKRCQCKGLIHAQFLKESWQNEKILAYSCDNCGSNYKFPVAKKKPHFRRKYR